jgi:DNA-directed RNA polymerase subunit L
MKSITDFTPIFNNGSHFKTDFTLENVPVYVANTLRRSFSSLVPTITFDDTYFDDIESRSIRIHKNTSALHNEFLSHRLSYVPIKSTNRKFFNIQSKFDNVGTRTFKFSKKDPKLIFKLNVKNNKDMAHNRDKLGLLNVKTSNFEIVSNDEETIDYSNFFDADVFTGDYIILDKLKQDLGNEDGGEELKIDCIPRISMGCKNTRNDPTGTVTYEMVVDETKTDEVFNHKKDYLNEERLKKGLPKFTVIEEKQLKTSFNLLDKDRVIQTNSNGDPNKFKFSVESIGFMNPNSIINDGLGMVLLSLKDIQNSMTFDMTSYEFTMNDKVEMNLLDSDNVNNGWMIKVINENHTIGNMLSNMIRNMWCINGVFLDHPVLKIAAYKMQHPTIEEIEFMLVPNDNTKLKKIEFIRAILRPRLVQDFNDKLNDFSQDKIDKLLCAVLFQKTLNYTIELLLNIKSEEHLKDIPLTFDVIDDNEWMEKNININGSISNAEELKNIYTFKDIMNISEEPESPRFQVTPEESKEEYQDETLSGASDDIILETVDDGSVEEESVIPGISKTLYEDSLNRYRLTYVSTVPFDSILKTMYTSLENKKDYRKLEITPKDFADIINMISVTEITPEDDSIRDIPVSTYTDEQGNNKTRILKLDYTNDKKYTFVDRKIVKK